MPDSHLTPRYRGALRAIRAGMRAASFDGMPPYASRAALSAAVTLALIYRACELGAHAAALREAHHDRKRRVEG